MTQKEALELLCQAEEELENNPEMARIVEAEVETMKMENPDFFERINDLFVSQLTKSDLKEMVDIVYNHNVRNKMAN